MSKKEVFYITLRRGRGSSNTKKIVIDENSYWELFHEIEIAITLPDVTSFSVRKPRGFASTSKEAEE